MSKPIIRIHDLATGEVLDREMTNAEFAQAKKDDENAAIIEAEAEAKAQAKAALFSKLGITAEEAALLLS